MPNFIEIDRAFLASSQMEESNDISLYIKLFVWQVSVPDTQKKLLPTLCCGYQIGVAEEGDARLAPSSTL